MHEDIRGTLLKFFGQHTSTAGFHILQRLKRLREAVQKSLFFRTHEVRNFSFLLVLNYTLNMFSEKNKNHDQCLDI